jgi:hypothetical protein
MKRSGRTDKVSNVNNMVSQVNNMVSQVNAKADKLAQVNAKNKAEDIKRRSNNLMS